MVKEFDPFQHIKNVLQDEYFFAFPNFKKLMGKWLDIIKLASKKRDSLHNIYLNCKPYTEIYEIRKDFYNDQEITYIFDVVKAGEWVKENLKVEN